MAKNIYSFFYDNGAEGGLSCIGFEGETVDSAWEQWWKMEGASDDLKVRLIVANIKDEQVLYQE